MKYLSEYRNLEATQQVIGLIEKAATQTWKIMEICGGQTHGLVRNGILELLPEHIQMIHGPGCPVCVTPVELIDRAVALMEQGAVLCSFGDMIRVPGSRGSHLLCSQRRQHQLFVGFAQVGAETVRTPGAKGGQFELQPGQFGA